MSSKQSTNRVSEYLSSSLPRDPGVGRIHALLSLLREPAYGDDYQHSSSFVHFLLYVTFDLEGSRDKMSLLIHPYRKPRSGLLIALGTLLQK